MKTFFSTLRDIMRRRKPLTVRDALNMYWDNHLAHKSYARCARYRINAIDSRLGKIYAAKISRIEIETYKRERGRTASPRTVQMELQILNAAINFATDNGALAGNTIKRFIHVPQNRPKKIVLDDGYENGPQWRAIYNAIHPKIKPILQTLYETGMRPKECFNMRRNWLKEKCNNFWVITVPRNIDKVGCERDIPVSRRLLKLFRAMKIFSLDGNALIFPAQRNSAKVRVNIACAFKHALERCGLSNQNITPYALRRTRLTIWDAIDGGACRYAAGHAVREVHSKHYVRISHERLFKLVGLKYTPSFRL